MYTTKMDQKYTNDMFQHYKDLDENLEVIKETLVSLHRVNVIEL